MDLSSLFSGFGSDPFANMMSVYNSAVGGLGAIQGMGNANAVNAQVQPQLSSNTSALQNQLATLQQQQQLQAQQAQDQYKTAQGNVGTANAGLQGNISDLTGQLQALSDPNSSYMQQARQAIERKDAAAGRNSQWGDRETQLAGTLGQYVAQYSPGMQNAITQANGQISQNNTGLASLYNTAYGPANSSMQQQIAAIQAQIANANAVNTTGRGAANSASNALTGTNGLLQQLGKAGTSLASLFGGGGGQTNTDNANPYSTTADNSLMNTSEQNIGMSGGDGGGYYTADSGQQYGGGSSYNPYDESQ